MRCNITTFSEYTKYKREASWGKNVFRTFCNVCRNGANKEISSVHNDAVTSVCSMKHCQSITLNVLHCYTITCDGKDLGEQINPS